MITTLGSLDESHHIYARESVTCAGLAILNLGPE